MSELNWKRLVSCRDEWYPAARALYEKSFPHHEQRTPPSQRAALECGDYHFDLIFQDGRFVGELLHWDTPAFSYVEHFCMEPSLRGQGLGQKALALLADRVGPVILEIDPPADEISRRRKGFYERCGFRENPYDHRHPPYHPGNEPHPLRIMSYPAVLDAAGCARFQEYLEQRVMVR